MKPNVCSGRWEEYNAGGQKPGLALELEDERNLQEWVSEDLTLIYLQCDQQEPHIPKVIKTKDGSKSCILNIQIVTYQLVSS